MKLKSRAFLPAAALTLVLTCQACFLIPAPRSQYRPIHQYAKQGDVALVSAYLATNAAGLNLPDDAGLTPLHLAALHCRTNVTAFLLEKGAAINRQGQGGATPLHLAAQEGCVAGVLLLLDRGAKINPRDDAKRTPLKRAEERHQEAVAEILRQHGGKD